MEVDVNEAVRKMNVARQVAAAIDIYNAFMNANGGAFTHELLVKNGAGANGGGGRTGTGGGKSNRIGPEGLRIA